jgi:hypothetical protein
LSKSEEDDDATIGQIFDPYQPVHNPHEEIGIEILVAEIMSCPLISPHSQGFNYRTELPAGGSKTIFVTSPVRGRFPLDNPTMSQTVKALAKQIARDPRHAPMEVGETPGAGQQFPQNQGRPALGEDLRSQCHGTKLSISPHGLQNDRISVAAQAQFELF